MSEKDGPEGRRVKFFRMSAQMSLRSPLTDRVGSGWEVRKIFFFNSNRAKTEIHMKTEIHLKGDALFNGEEQVGVYDAERNVLSMPKRISPKLYAPIAEALGKKPEYDFGTPKTKIHAEIPQPFHKGMKDSDAGQVVSLDTALNVPPPPPKDLKSGDKTPAYIEWFRVNHSPEEFAARYGHRKFGREEPAPAELPPIEDIDDDGE